MDPVKIIYPILILIILSIVMFVICDIYITCYPHQYM
jgi:hypothetical protein